MSDDLIVKTPHKGQVIIDLKEDGFLHQRERHTGGKYGIASQLATLEAEAREFLFSEWLDHQEPKQ